MYFYPARIRNTVAIASVSMLELHENIGQSSAIINNSEPRQPTSSLVGCLSAGNITFSTHPMVEALLEKPLERVCR